VPAPRHTLFPFLSQKSYSALCRKRGAGQWDAFQKNRRFDSYNRNCSDTVMQALGAGGAGNFVPLPKNWVLPTSPNDVLQYTRNLQLYNHISWPYGISFSLLVLGIAQSLGSLERAFSNRCWSVESNGENGMKRMVVSFASGLCLTGLVYICHLIVLRHFTWQDKPFMPNFFTNLLLPGYVVGMSLPGPHLLQLIVAVIVDSVLYGCGAWVLFTTANAAFRSR